MPRKAMSMLGLFAMLSLNACSHNPALPLLPECPRFRPSAEALEPVKAPDWLSLTKRLPQKKPQTPSQPEQN